MFSTGKQQAFLSLKPCLGRVLEALLPILTDVQAKLAVIHTASIEPDTFLNEMCDLGVRVANLGEVLRQYKRTYPLVAHSTPESPFNSCSELQESLASLLRKPQTYTSVMPRYQVSQLFEWFIFAVVSLAWYRGRMTDTNCDGPIMDCFAQLVWGLYCLRPMRPDRDADTERKCLQIMHQDRPAYCLSVLHGLLLLTESSSFSGAPALQTELRRNFSQWLFQDHRKTVSFITYNCLLNPLRIKEFGKTFDVELLIVELAHAIEIIQAKHPDCQYCFFQEINDYFDIKARKQVTRMLANTTPFDHCHYAAEHRAGHVSSGTIIASVHEITSRYAKTIALPSLFTLPESGDSIMLKDLLFHGTKDMITDNMMLVTRHEDPTLGKLCCINAHLISGEDFNASHKRKFQLKLIKNYIDTISADTAVVIMGDFNQVPDDTIEMIKALNFPRPYVTSLNKVHQMMRFETHSGKRIDYCFHSQHVELVCATVCDSGDFVSDHLPVLFRFRSAMIRADPTP